MLTSLFVCVGDKTSQKNHLGRNTWPATPHVGILPSLYPARHRRDLSSLPSVTLAVTFATTCKNAKPSHGRFQESVVHPLGLRPSSPQSSPTLDFFSALMSTSLTLQPLADFIRHGKHARAAQSAEPSPADGHATARDQRLYDQQPADRREPEHSVAAERERERERHDQTKEMAEAIVKEENAAKERMPLIKGLERFKLLAKMGECVSSSTPLATDLMHQQRCILTRIQGHRYRNRPESR